MLNKVLYQILNLARVACWSCPVSCPTSKWAGHAPDFSLLHVGQSARDRSIAVFPRAQVTFTCAVVISMRRVLLPCVALLALATVRVQAILSCAVDNRQDCG